MGETKSTSIWIAHQINSTDPKVINKLNYKVSKDDVFSTLENSSNFTEGKGAQAKTKMQQQVQQSSKV